MFSQRSSVLRGDSRGETHLQAETPSIPPRILKNPALQSRLSSSPLPASCDALFSGRSPSFGASVGSGRDPPPILLRRSPSLSSEVGAGHGMVPPVVDALILTFSEASSWSSSMGPVQPPDPALREAACSASFSAGESSPSSFSQVVR
jgi:hypothetical protein